MAYVRSKMRTMGMLGKKHKGPLRDVVAVERLAEGLFDHDVVLLACGHKGYRSPGALRCRCARCGDKNIESKEHTEPAL